MQTKTGYHIELIETYADIHKEKTKHIDKRFHRQTIRTLRRHSRNYKRQDTERRKKQPES